MVWVVGGTGALVGDRYEGARRTLVYFLYFFFFFTKVRRIMRTIPSITVGVSRSIRVANVMRSAGGRPVVKMSMVIGNAAGKAIASVSKGCDLSIRKSGDMLMFSFMKCMAGRIAIKDRGAVGMALTRSSGVVSRMIIVNFRSRGGKGLATTMTSIDTRALRSEPITGVKRTLRNVIPNLGVDVRNNSPGGIPGLGVHNTAAFHRENSSGSSGGGFSMISNSPLVLVSNIRVATRSLGRLGPGSVSGVSFLGSTSTSTVCNAETAFNIVLIAAGSKACGRGTGVSCSCGLTFSRPCRLPSVLSSCRVCGTNTSGEL